jgi:hypothetical protein
MKKLVSLILIISLSAIAQGVKQSAWTTTTNADVARTGLDVPSTTDLHNATNDLPKTTTGGGISAAIIATPVSVSNNLVMANFDLVSNRGLTNSSDWVAAGTQNGYPYYTSAHNWSAYLFWDADNGNWAITNALHNDLGSVPYDAAAWSSGCNNPDCGIWAYGISNGSGGETDIIITNSSGVNGTVYFQTNYTYKTNYILNGTASGNVIVTNLLDFGATNDGFVVTSLIIATGSTNLEVGAFFPAASGKTAFDSSVIGKTIMIWEAGAAVLQPPLLQTLMLLILG